MDDKKKVIGLVVIVVIGLAFAIWQGAGSMNERSQEKVVGTLDMGAGGGRNAEAGGAAPSANTTPETPRDINANPAGVGP